MTNLFLLLLIIVLLIPQSLSQTVRKAWPFFACLLAVCLLALSTQLISESKPDQLQVRALNEGSESSGGVEIWLQKVVIDGEARKPEEVFSDGWITSGNSLVWRPYEQKEGMTKAITATCEPGAEVELIFQANQWRGKVEISYGGREQIVDCYSPGKDFGETISAKIIMPALENKGYSFTAKRVVVYILMTLVILNAIYAVLYYLKKKSFPKGNVVYSERVIWFDVLKVISAGMVVLIHSSASLYNEAFKENTSLWLKGLWVHAIPRFAVPCFLMITGALLLKKNYDFDGKLFKRVGRILIPLVFWSTCNIVFRKLFWNTGENILTEILKIPFDVQASALWYAYQLIWLYLGMPFWQMLYRHLTKRMRWSFVIFSLGIPGILTMLGELSLFGVPEYLPFASINMMVCYVGMLFLGGLLYDIVNESKKHIIFICGAGLTAAGLGIMIAASIYLSNRSGQSMHTFFSEVRIPGVLYGSGIFLLTGSLKNWFNKWPAILKSAVASISAVSLGIFMTHGPIIAIFSNITVGGREISKNNGSVSQLLICVMIYYGITAAGCFLASRLPGLKRLVL